MWMLFVTIPIFLVSFQAGVLSESFLAGVVVFFGLHALLGAVLGIIRKTRHQAQVDRQMVLQRRMRTHLNINDVAFAHQLLDRFGLLTEEIDKTIDAEVRASSFSNIPLSVRKIEERLAGVTLHDADEALEFMSGELFLAAAQAQVIQDRIDQRMAEGRIMSDETYDDSARGNGLPRIGPLTVG